MEYLIYADSYSDLTDPFTEMLSRICFDVSRGCVIGAHAESFAKDFIKRLSPKIYIFYDYLMRFWWLVVGAVLHGHRLIVRFNCTRDLRVGKVPLGAPSQPMRCREF
jgi:hypothetical protein